MEPKEYEDTPDEQAWEDRELYLNYVEAMLELTPAMGQEKDEKFIEERKHAEWLQRQIDEDVKMIYRKNKEIALWKQAHRAADKDNIELREENATLIKDAALNAQMLASEEHARSILAKAIAQIEGNSIGIPSLEILAGKVADQLTRQTDLAREAETEAAELRRTLESVAFMIGDEALK